MFLILFNPYVELQSKKRSNWINIGGSFINHSLNDK